MDTLRNLVIPTTWFFGVMFLIIAVWGFITGAAFNIFEVDTTHNFVHLSSAIAAFVCAGYGYTSSRWYLIIFGLVYGLVMVLGFMDTDGEVMGMEINQADNYLHLGITLLALSVGVLGGSER